MNNNDGQVRDATAVYAAGFQAVQKRMAAVIHDSATTTGDAGLMDRNIIELSAAQAPFRPVEGKRGACFRRFKQPDDNGSIIEVEHNGHDAVVLDARRQAKPGEKSPVAMLIRLDSHEAVQLASILLYMANEHMRDSAERPFYAQATPERTGFGDNWLLEDAETAIPRLNRRRERSHVLGLMQRCLEVCEDDTFIKELCMNLALWARRSGDEFAHQKAEQALTQMNMMPDLPDPTDD